MSDEINYEQYLSLYVADIDWAKQLAILKRRSKPVSGWDPNSIRKVRNQVACAILLPKYDKSVISDPPEKILFTCVKFAQFEERDWLEELQEVVRTDRNIEEVRKQALKYGFVYPIPYNPRSRQAFTWLTERVDKAEVQNTKKAHTNMENLVYVYGGAVICNIFGKPEYEKKINNLLNWRSGYFFERLIHEIYKPHEILKIKQHDIEEIKRSNPKMIKYSKNQEASQ